MSGRFLFVSNSKVSKEVFMSALNKMGYGEPCVPACYSEYGTVKLGYNPLHFDDCDSGNNKPLVSQDGRYAIIYNGKVYNYRELACDHNIKICAHSDMHVVLELSVKIGFERTLNLLNGMFAYVIYDTFNGEYFAARDRLGIKPLYIYKNFDGIAFSSEINGIIRLLDGKVDIHPVSVRQYKRLRGCFHGKTIYKGIDMLPAGCFIEHGKITKWWKLPSGEQAPPTDEELYSLIESTINYCMIDSGESTGVLLSGGLDSTIVAAMIGKEHCGTLHTWISGFYDMKNEYSYGRIAAEAVGSCHHETGIYKKDFLSKLKSIIAIIKEPLSFQGGVPTLDMYSEVKKHNPAVLCALGADELFFGYDRIFRWAESQTKFDVKSFSENYSHGATDNDIEIVELILEPFYEYGPKPIDIVSAFLQTSKLEVNFRPFDTFSAMCSVETRMPLSDHRLVERLFAVPFDWKMKDGIVKAPLKRVFSHLVPKVINDRPKLGFSEGISLADLLDVPRDKAFDAWTDTNLSLLET